jgi:hypothetical protein
MKICFFLIFCQLLLMSCSKREKRNLTEANSDFSLHESEPMGQYLAVLKPLNEQVSGKVTGAMTLSREEDELIGDVRFSGGPLTAKVIHSQSVHSGRRCPTLEDDINNDGFIDGVEGEIVYGKILIPLDGDLNSQRMGGGIYPIADDFGSYVYSQLASYEKFKTDLYEIDLDPKDQVMKIKEGDIISFSDKAVVIFGISKSADLPDSVASNTRFGKFQSFPIACGILKKITTIPGTLHQDDSGLPLPQGASVGGSGGGLQDGATIVPPSLGRGRPGEVDRDSFPSQPRNNNYGDE